MPQSWASLSNSARLVLSMRFFDRSAKTPGASKDSAAGRRPVRTQKPGGRPKRPPLAGEMAPSVRPRRDCGRNASCLLNHLIEFHGVGCKRRMPSDNLSEAMASSFREKAEGRFVEAELGDCRACAGSRTRASGDSSACNCASKSGLMVSRSQPASADLADVAEARAHHLGSDAMLLVVGVDAGHGLHARIVGGPASPPRPTRRRPTSCTSRRCARRMEIS